MKTKLIIFGMFSCGILLIIQPFVWPNIYPEPDLIIVKQPYKVEVEVPAFKPLEYFGIRINRINDDVFRFTTTDDSRWEISVGKDGERAFFELTRQK